MKLRIIFGPPGTGKTTYLINQLELFLQQGYQLSDIIYCTFTKSAAKEVRERIIEKFKIDRKDIPFFGTIHSLCHSLLNLDPKLLVDEQDKKDFCKKLNIKYEISLREKEFSLADNYEDIDTEGNILFNFYESLRIIGLKSFGDLNEDMIKEEFFKMPISGSTPYKDLFFKFFSPLKFIQLYENFKTKNSKHDFTDMLTSVWKNKLNINAKILIVDEFQDLTNIQYAIYNSWKEGKEHILIAGDEDQNIYSYMGASPNFMLNEKEYTSDIVILKKSYRLKQNIVNYCRKIIENINEREYKDYYGYEEGGEIKEFYWAGRINDLDLIRNIRKDKRTFLLFRTNRMKNIFTKNFLQKHQMPYREIRGKSPWSNKTINIINAIVKIKKDLPLNLLETKMLITALPTKPFLKRGMKKKIMEMKKEEITTNELYEIGLSRSVKEIPIKNLISYLYLNKNISKFLENYDNHNEIISEPKIFIGTIHSAKGREADDVFLFKDLTRRIIKEASRHRSHYEAEIRTSYVGASRVKEKLFIIKNSFPNCDSKLIP